MKISETHLCFAYKLNNPRALENPEEFLGPNWKDVLNFWFYSDTLSVDLKRKANVLYWSDGQNVPRYLAWDVAIETVGQSNSSYVLEASELYYVGYTTLELIGAHKILEQGKSLTFVPLFLNL
jgi:hypothetical protein